MSNGSVVQQQSDNTLCLTSDWLNPPGEGHPTISWTDWTAPTYQHPTYWPGYWRAERKISLKLSEVMYLRELACEDKKLRKTLKKFAPLIEIEVDFPGGE